MKNKIHTKSILLFVLVILILVSCAPVIDNNDLSGKYEMDDKGRIILDWKEVTPPPGIEGPCWIFVHAAYGQYSLSNVVCENK